LGLKEPQHKTMISSPGSNMNIKTDEDNSLPKFSG